MSKIGYLRQPRSVESLTELESYVPLDIQTSTRRPAKQLEDNRITMVIYVTENALGNDMRIGETEMLTLMSCLPLDSLWR